MPSYCSAPSPNWVKFRERFNKEYYDSKNKEDNGSETLYINIRYVVLYGNEEQKVNIDKIKALHETLNFAFSNKNTDELDKVPDNDKYPWKSLIGNPNIQFLPLNNDDLQVEYISIDKTSLNDKTPVIDAMKLSNPVDGDLNIYIGENNKNILGQAAGLGSNSIFIDKDVVGGKSYPGNIEKYDLGKTVIHEVGHALSLPHTFADDACDHSAVFPDIPEQVNPNYYTQLVYENGSWTCKNDNRYNDRISPTNTSCLHIQSNPNTAVNEMGINYMDYGDDRVSIMFTKSQATMMRSYLQSPENKNFILRSSSGLYKSNGGIGSLSPTVIALIITGSVIFLLLIIAIYTFYKNRKSGDMKEKVKKYSSLYESDSSIYLNYMDH